MDTLIWIVSLPFMLFMGYVVVVYGLMVIAFVLAALYLMGESIVKQLRGLYHDRKNVG